MITQARRGRPRTIGTQGKRSPLLHAQDVHPPNPRVTTRIRCSLLTHFFESSYLMIRLSDCNDSKRTIDVQTVLLLMHMFSSLVPTHTRIAHGMHATFERSEHRYRWDPVNNCGPIVKRECSRHGHFLEIRIPRNFRKLFLRKFFRFFFTVSKHCIA